MKTGTKIVIGVVIGVGITIVLIIGLVLGGFGGFIYLLDRNYKEGAKKEKQARIDGREFGRTTNQNGCMEKGFSLKSDHEFNDVILDFVRECLESSEPIPDFCDPAYDYKSGWTDKRCETCHDTIYVKKRYCSDSTRNDQTNLEGRKFGKKTDQNGCMEKGFTFPGDSLRKSFFMFGCLRTSRPTPDFCQGVPGYDDKWAGEQCEKAGDNKDSCVWVFKAKQSFCR